ncbi:hypothetical protein B0H13DRAFT_2328719 [Mycena leptocephala]|nr:hypothetical protein B0H13DRAFT_2328719 [Mycena leptocephala]
MPSYLTTALALAFAFVSFSSSAAAVTCAVCPSTIFYQGQTRTLTTTREDTGNTIQCSFNTPAISGFSPACLYGNVNGALTFTNTSPNACPGTATLVSKTSC